MKTKRKRLDEPILAEGEVTGHAHRVAVPVYESENGVREFEGATDVTHEEHKPITLPDSSYASARVQEFDHFAEEARVVRD